MKPPLARIPRPAQAGSPLVGVVLILFVASAIAAVMIGNAIGSVRLTEKMVVERYSHVMHIVSNVTGRLRPGLTAIDALRATFPAGTVSGAPKIRAMEIIDELEPVKRGVYAGAVGYLSWSGNMDTAIAIRTAILKDGMLHIQAGGGVVADSIPAMEWEETMNKGRALFRAAALAQQGLDEPKPVGELKSPD